MQGSRTLFAGLGFPPVLLGPAGDKHQVVLAEALGDVLGQFPPGRDGEEPEGICVLAPTSPLALARNHCVVEAPVTEALMALDARIGE